MSTSNNLDPISGSLEIKLKMRLTEWENQIRYLPSRQTAENTETRETIETKQTRETRETRKPCNLQLVTLFIPHSAICNEIEDQSLQKRMADL